MNKFQTKSSKETQLIGEKTGRDLAHQKSSALVFALVGELGTGKTTFTQGFAKGLGVKEKLVSPTFILMRIYHPPARRPFKNFYHLDLYRLASHNDASELGFSEIFQDRENVVVIEWADKISSLLPPQTKFIEFRHISQNKRSIVFRETL